MKWYKGIDWDDVWEALMKLGVLIVLFGLAVLVWMVIIGATVAAITGAKF